MEVATCLLAHLILATPLFAQPCLSWTWNRLHPKCKQNVHPWLSDYVTNVPCQVKIQPRSYWGLVHQMIGLMACVLFENLTHCHSLLPRWKWPVEDYARSGGRQATNSNFGFCNSEFPLFNSFNKAHRVDIWSTSQLFVNGQLWIPVQLFRCP